MSLADGNFDRQAIDEVLAKILESGEKIVMRPNVWYWASSDPRDGIRFAEIPDPEVYL